MAKSLILIEGDSWERLPNFGAKSLPTVGGSGYDLARALADLDYPIENLAYWGDTIADIARTKAYLNALRDLEPLYMLLGGGGNDLLGNGRLQTYLRLFDKDRPLDQYLKPNFNFDLDTVMENYRIVLTDIYSRRQFETLKVIVHGYDYAEPMKLGWIGEPMAAQGIDEFRPELQAGIVKIMIDSFNERLAALTRTWPNLVYVDFRGQVKGRWHDELHPTKEAFEVLALHLEATALA